MISFLLWDPSLWNTTKKLGPEWVNSRIKAAPETAPAAATHLGRLMSVCSGREQGPQSMHYTQEASLLCAKGP